MLALMVSDARVDAPGRFINAPCGDSHYGGPGIVAPPLAELNMILLVFTLGLFYSE